VAERQSDRAVALDGTVGVALDADDAPATWSEASWLHVSASHDALSEAGRIGLEDDLRRLVHAFAEGGPSLCREITQDLLDRASARSPSPDRHGELDIRLHGLGLEPADEEELGRLIGLVVRARLVDGEMER
jgi:hypothetical protein